MLLPSGPVDVPTLWSKEVPAVGRPSFRKTIWTSLPIAPPGLVGSQCRLARRGRVCAGSGRTVPNLLQDELLHQQLPAGVVGHVVGKRLTSLPDLVAGDFPC